MAYIGQTLREGQMQTYSHVATAGQTSFPCSYGVGSSSVSVFQNGVLLSASDVTLTSGSAAVLNVAAAANDEITIQVQDVFSVADTVSAANGGTFAGNVTHSGTLTASGAFTSLGIDDNATSTAMTLDASGNVGIGLSSSLDGLNVNGAVRSQNNASNISYIGFTSYTGTTAAGAMYSYVAGDGRSTGYLNFNTNDTERMRVDSDGNVGINTLQPSTTLTVNGTHRIEIDSNASGTYSDSASLHRDGALVFPVTASQTTQTSNNGGGWATIGWATTARSGEQMHRNTELRYANGGSGTAMGFYIEAGTGEAGGICLDEDSVQVYGSSDNGTTFRIIDKDADIVVAEMLQTSWNWNVRGSVNANSSMSSISDQRLKKGFQDVSSDGILDSFSDLQLKSYIRVDTYDYMKNKYEDEEELREVGFVAQEVEQIFPDCVGTTPIVDPRGMDSVWEEIGEELTEIKNVNINQLLYKTMQTVQVLIKENKALKARVEALES